jgi:hypothetical protein
VSAVTHIVSDQVVRTPAIPAGTATTTRPFYNNRLVLALIIVALVVAIGYRGQIEYYERVYNCFMQRGLSLSPQVADNISWSFEVPLTSGEIPVVGNLYSYKRPEKSTWDRILAAIGLPRTATKWCWKVYADGSWESMTDDGRISRDQTLRRVISIWQKSDEELRKTPEGQFEIWAKFHLLPNKWVMTSERRSLGVVSAGWFRHIDINGRVLFQTPALDYTSGLACPVRYANGHFVFKNSKELHVYACYDTETKRLSSFNALDSLPMVVDLKPTDTEYIVLRPGAVARVDKPINVEVGEASESCEIPTPQVDGKTYRVPMQQTFRVTSTMRNAGKDTFVIRVSSQPVLR